MANNTVTIYVDSNVAQISETIQSDRFGLFTAQEWKRLIDPYTPRDTGALQDTAYLSPWRIHYIQPYAEKVYYGENLNFQKKNPYSTYRWDTAAEQAGQADKLSQTLNAALQSGLY